MQLTMYFQSIVMELNTLKSSHCLQFVVCFYQNSYTPEWLYYVRHRVSEDRLKNIHEACVKCIFH